MKIELWGRGAEIAVGAVSTEKYYFWQALSEEYDEIIVEELLGEVDEGNDDDIPADMRLGAWYELDDLAHETGPFLNDAYLIVRSDDDEVLWEGSIDSIKIDDLWEETDDFYFVETDEKYAIMVCDLQKGQFESYTVEGVNTWDPSLLKVGYVDIEGNNIVTSIKYNGVDLEGNSDLSTDGKGWDWEWLSNVEEDEDD